jgi:thioredoxin reductase (NADPH)
MESVLVRYNGTDRLESVDIKNIRSGAVRTFRTDGVFVFIGYIPNTSFLKNKLPLNSRDEIVVSKDMETSVAGIFAAGDSIEKRYRQISTAVGDATIAALAATEYTYRLKEEASHALIN